MFRLQFAGLMMGMFSLSAFAAEFAPVSHLLASSPSASSGTTVPAVTVTVTPGTTDLA